MPSPPRTRTARRIRALQQKSWLSRQPMAKRSEARRRHNLWRRYRITPEQFDALLTSQGNCCAICRSPDPRHRHGWHVDHNHTTGKIRGILCNHCNVAVGMTNEDPVRLLQIAMYLREHE